MIISVFFLPIRSSNHPQINVLAKPPNPPIAAIHDASSSFKGLSSGVSSDCNSGMYGELHEMKIP